MYHLTRHEHNKFKIKTVKLHKKFSDVNTCMCARVQWIIFGKVCYSYLQLMRLNCTSISLSYQTHLHFYFRESIEQFIFLGAYKWWISLPHTQFVFMNITLFLLRRCQRKTASRRGDWSIRAYDH